MNTERSPIFQIDFAACGHTIAHLHHCHGNNGGQKRSSVL
jgi:hypothetical protein